MRSLRSLSLLTAASAVLCAPFLISQTAAQTPAAPRIKGSVDETSLTTLKGNVSHVVQPQYDQGEASSSTQLNFVRLVLSRSPRQEAALEAFMAQQIDKSSPNYHHWLTPEQLGSLYGPADSDVAAIVAWLQSHGLKVETIPTSRTNIPFSGTVSQIEAAFHTPIHSYVRNGSQFYSNTADPRIPSALASVVIGVAHLNTLNPRSYRVGGGLGVYDPQQKKLLPASSGSRVVKPNLTTGNASEGYALYVTAADGATIYDTPNMFNANFSSGTSYTGSGVTIGIGGDALIQASTVVSYRTVFLNGNTTAPIITNIGSSATAGDDTDEAYIDTELSGGLAPGATIHFYTASDAAGGIQSAIQQALQDNTVDIFSLSFGACELDLTTADNQLVNSLWQQAAGQGIAVTVSTGDSGSASCDNDNTETSAITGLQVSGFASTPYNIAVGGTDFYGLINNFTTYVGTSGNAAGVASNYYRSALGYILESTWNDSTSTDGLIGNNVPAEQENSTNTAEVTNIVAGGGGVSLCSVNTSTDTVNGTCTSGYPKPSWQRGTNVPDDGARDLPDLALMAGNGFDGAAWLICTDDTGTVSGATVTANCTGQANKEFYFEGFGGTSTSAPAFAGILALVEQSVGSRLGSDVPKNLYDLFNSSHASAVFHDITQGNNSVVCTEGTSSCAKNSGGYYFLGGYNTGTGYDLATGIGSVDATALITYWNESTGSGVVTVSAAAVPSAIETNQPLNVSVTVSSATVGNPTPTGTVSVTGGGYTSSSESLTSGSYIFTIPAGSLTAGTDTLTVTYSGDANYATATGTASVTVTQATLLTPSVSVTPASTSIDSSQALNLTVSVTGSGATPTGTVTLTGGGYTGTAAALSGGAATIAIPANSFTTSGTDTLSVAYSGDSVYTAATGTATVAVSISAFTATSSTTSSSPATAAPGTPITTTITVSGSNGYTGSIDLSCALATSPSGAIDLPTCAVSGSPIALSGSTTSGTATVTINSTAATTSRLDRRGLPGGLPALTGAGGGAVLAILLFFGIPAKRRNLRHLLGLLIVMAALGTLSACGGGGGGGGGGGTGNAGTTAGSYTFTITGTGTPAVSPAPSATVYVTIN